MSTRTRRARCSVCRNVLPKATKNGKCGACKGQTVLFPLRIAQRLSRPSSRGKGGA